MSSDNLRKALESSPEIGNKLVPESMLPLVTKEFYRCDPCGWSGSSAGLNLKQYISLICPKCEKQLRIVG